MWHLQTLQLKEWKQFPGVLWSEIWAWYCMDIGDVMECCLSQASTQNWNLYRLSLARMRSLQSHSTHWRATCSYPIKGIDFRDYLRGNFKDFNIFDFNGEGKCKKVEYVNIRGHVGLHLTAPFWQSLNKWTLHIDSTSTGCQFKAAKTGSVTQEDNFGWYGTAMNSNFRCTQGTQSTTQWWFGAHL